MDSFSRFATIDVDVAADTLSAAEDRLTREVDAALGNPDDNRALTLVYALILDFVASIDVEDALRTADPDRLDDLVEEYARDRDARRALKKNVVPFPGRPPEVA